MHLKVVETEEFPSVAADVIENVLQQKSPVNICFPTGDTPKNVYLELERRVNEQVLSFSGVTGFGLDEWGALPENHPIRCSNRIRQDLYNRVDILEYYYIEPQAKDIAAECARYEAFIQSKGGLDLCVLGVGLNGHVGFNEPGSQLDSRTRRITLDTVTKSVSHKYGWETEQPNWGVTLGIGTILESKQILVMACGAHKADIVAQALQGPKSSDTPVSLLRDHPNIIFLVDAEAASTLG